MQNQFTLDDRSIVSGFRFCRGANKFRSLALVLQSGWPRQVQYSGHVLADGNRWPRYHPTSWRDTNETRFRGKLASCTSCYRHAKIIVQSIHFILPLAGIPFLWRFARNIGRRRPTGRWRRRRIPRFQSTVARDDEVPLWEPSTLPKYVLRSIPRILLHGGR